MNSLDDTFTRLLGRQPSDSERQQLYRVRDALEIKNNDALWLVLMALQHYQSMYEEFPSLIGSAAHDALVNFKQVAEATAKAAAQAAKADLTTAVATAARDVARYTAGRSMAQWIACCALSICFVLMMFGWYVDSSAHTSGYNSGYTAAYELAKDEKAAAAWANTPEGRKAWPRDRLRRLHAGATNRPAGYQLWNGLDEENRAHWLTVAGSAVPVDAWQAWLHAAAYTDAEEEAAAWVARSRRMRRITAPRRRAAARSQLARSFPAARRSCLQSRCLPDLHHRFAPTNFRKNRELPYGVGSRARDIFHHPPVPYTLGNS